MVAAALLAVTTMAACSSDELPSAAADEDSRTSPTASGPSTSALTGLPADAGVTTGPLLVAKIDNTASATPQLGLDEADLVVEELVEGGATRLAAFFQSAYPEEVGPVRSMRATDIGIVPAGDDTRIVTSGAAGRTIERITAAGIEYVEEGASGFFRAEGRRLPYDLFADLEVVADEVDGDGERPADYLPWGEHEAYASGAGAASIDVTFSPRHTTSWELDGGGYVIDGGYAEDGFAADTVITVEVEVVDAGYLDPAGNPVPESLFEGTGAATVFHGGRAVAATWSKDAEDASVGFTTADGAALTVPPGRTWIELVPADTGDVSYR
ncbi:DUF3048 domain-containing protein [Nocardioides zeae]|uniref:DUF3048 domain-containing protein n=1 Tax=Nocardioides imazamoxiresistens TaxID=3231893 RepID=A0ABU3PQQ3_9ACTN|nr:DUF3048 domain-containing protein [Nocardioides zeae]MDT9591539.1 DUF3048 domain-containing protein [Nocardioides zeae]